jgi:tetratricopeptide (TPR) repeat protein
MEWVFFNHPIKSEVCMRKSLKFLMVVALVLAWVVSRTVSYGSGNSSPQSQPGDDNSKKVADLYSRGMAATQANDFQKALDLFGQALQLEPNNPDVLNMLAHSQRKACVRHDGTMDIGLMDEAMENYWKALRIKPKFPEAREYLGEAYLQAALNEVKTLKSYGKDGEEQLKDLNKALKEAADGLEKN